MKTDELENNFIYGIDEVGRGPVAGPTVVCLCGILENIKKKDLENELKLTLQDSKKLTEKNREKWRDFLIELQEQSKCIFAIGQRDSVFIDNFGISKAINESIDDCLLKINPEKNAKIFLDGGIYLDKVFTNQETIIKGDENILPITLASIFAKVYRDNLMNEMDAKFPNYNLKKHKGYGTKEHFDAIKKHGTCEIHRTTYLRNL